MGDLMPIVTIGGAIVLGVVLAYGLFQNARRDRRKDVVTETATRDLYDKVPAGDASDNPPSNRPEAVKAGEATPRFEESSRT